MTRDELETAIRKLERAERKFPPDKYRRQKLRSLKQQLEKLDKEEGQ